MALVQLKRGDMFDGPADLIVLPCSTGGTITSFVRQRLVHHRIPYPKAAAALGDVSVMPFEGGENIAQFVAYAASVENNASEADAIRRIGRQLGDATNRWPTIRRVSAPLLGAGAGGLDDRVVVDALTSGFKQTAHPDACLVIHVLDAGDFRRLSRRERPRLPIRREETPQPPVRVFISYSHTSPEHEQWVERLGTFLRNNGVDARMDVWHLRYGMDLPQFMTNELALASRVLLVSDEKYAEKADGSVGGVGWETMIVQGDMYQQPPTSTKYVVIVTSRKLDQGLPRYLKSKFVIHWPDATHDEKNHGVLLRELYNVVAVPPLGRPPVFI